MDDATLPDWIASPLSAREDALVHLDLCGRIVALNAEARVLARIGEAAAIGAPFEDAFPIRDEFTGLVPGPLTRRVVLPVAGDEFRTFDLLAIPLAPPRGEDEAEEAETDEASCARAVVLRRAIPSGRAESEAWASLSRTARSGTGLGDPHTETLGIVSDSFAAVHGYTPREMLGLPLRALLPPPASGAAYGPDEPAHAVDRYLEGLRRGSGVQTWETVHVRKDGAPFPVRVSGVTVRDPLGAVRFSAIRVEDLSELRAAELRAAEALAALREARGSNL